jgi:DNA-binding MarR family transcriptional regulator/GNAT superfamily N-acetyltransferase
MTETQVLRRFNRTWSQRVGVLDDSHLGTGLALGPSRVLFEVGSEPAGLAVAALRERLGLDSGHLSRLLRTLEGSGLVQVEADPDDARRRTARLTPAGAAALADLDRRSDALADRLVAPLTPRQRTRLAGALATADLLVRAATVELREVGAADPGARAATRAYVAELAALFPAGFDPGPPDDEGMADAAFLLATSDGAPVGYGGVRALPAGPGITAGTGEVKRMWVDPTWRGAGLGSRLLREIEALARRRGHDRLVLDTNGGLTDAIALYERAGYARVERYNDNPHAEAFFAKDL